MHRHYGPKLHWKRKFKESSEVLLKRTLGEKLRNSKYCEGELELVQGKYFAEKRYWGCIFLTSAASPSSLVAHRRKWGNAKQDVWLRPNFFKKCWTLGSTW